MMKAPILSMMIIVLAALCLSVVSAGKSMSSSMRSGMKHKQKKSHSSSSKMKSSKVTRYHKSRYSHAMNYHAARGQGGGGDDGYYGTGRYRGNGGGGGKGKGVFSHDNDSSTAVNQDVTGPGIAPTPAPIAYVVPPTFEQHTPGTPTPAPNAYVVPPTFEQHTAAPIPTLFLPTVNGPTTMPATKTGNGWPTTTPTFYSPTVNGTSPTNAQTSPSPNGAGSGPSGAPAPASTGNVDQEEYEPQPLCETTNGIFGSLEGQSVTVYFSYELETSPISDEELIEEVLPALEVKFNDLILPTIFPKTCAVTVLTRRRLVVEGISARPDDEPMSTDEVSCLLLSFPDSACRIVRGMLTIFVVDYQESDSIRVRDALEAAMKDNSFEDVDPSIKRVAYVTVKDDSFQSPKDPVDEGDGNKDLDGNDNFTSSNSLLVGLVVAGASGICLAAGAVTYSRIARKDAAPDSIVGGSNADVPASQITPYDSASIDTSASISTAGYQLPSNSESILVYPEQDVESVDDMLEPPEAFVTDGSEESLLANTDHQQPQHANEQLAT